MAKVIKCPRCQSQIDVTNIAGGTTVKCSCGAQVRIPTGQTGQFKTPEPPAAPAQSKGTERKTKKRERQTALFSKMSNVRAPGDRSPIRGGGGDRAGAAAPQSNKNMIIAACVGGGLLVIGVIAFAMSSGKKDRGTDTGKKSEGKSSSNVFQPVDYHKSTASTTGGSSATSSGGGGNPTPGPKTYQAPAAFEKGARALLSSTMSTNASSQLITEVSGMLTRDEPGPILKDQDKYLGGAIECVLSDDERLAKAALSCCREVYRMHRRVYAGTDQNPIDEAYANSAQYRADKYVEIVKWFNMNQDQLNAILAQSGGGSSNTGGGGTGGQDSQPKKETYTGNVDWDKIIEILRTGGVAAMRDKTRPEYDAFQQLKAMGKAAYPKLISYFDGEELGLIRSIHAVLCELTGQKFDEPKISTKGAVKSQWLEWYDKNK